MLQTLSPYNKGLIRRAISQSGVAVCPWAIQKNPLFWAKRVRRSCGGQGRGLPLFHSVLNSITLCPEHWPHPPAYPPPLQIAEKVGCPLDDTSRMAKCLKITDPRALTLAYKLPLAGRECEWRLLGEPGGAPGRERAGHAPGEERNCRV